MPPEILALIEKPHLLVAVLFVGAFAGMTVEQFISRVRKQAWRARNRSRWDQKRNGASIAIGPWLPTRNPEPPKQPDANRSNRTSLNGRLEGPSLTERRTTRSSGE
ncbi:hypothetical protein GFL92_08940 [Rhizobium leguminosarum bv. viciae]|nr:hypothetical protein [Rhizobium leguminosarum bv. viciae]TCB58335.1 hypothetical protein E0J20_13310 [Rhizobium leguminosarum bv. viciae]